MNNNRSEERYSLNIRLLGGFDIRRANELLPRTRTRSEQWLLSLLLLRQNRETERNWLAGTLWPDSDEPQALYNLRRSLSDLRHVLGADAHRLIAPTPRTIALDASYAFVDILEFDRAIAPGDSASLEQAVNLYRGPLLEGCLEEWVLAERQRYERNYLAALDALASQAVAQQNHPAAIEYLFKALACDPLREATLQALMRAMTESGDTVGAMAVYRQFRLRLNEALQAEPDAETVALYRHIRGANGKKRSNQLSAAPNKPTSLYHLPHPLTPLIGREAEITKIERCLREARLVTLVGMGGVGKTRLAIAIAHQIAREYAEGVYFCDVSGLTDPAQLTPTVAALLRASGERESGAPDTLNALDALCRFLAEKSLLLILDNCEHLIQACAELTEAVLHRCPHVRVLATSRQGLGIPGERSWRVPGLSLPESATLSPALSGPTENALLAQFVKSDAVSLFIEGAVAANGAFRLSIENIKHVIKICRSLDGIPFALELASAWIKSLTVAQIAERLDNRFEFLTGGGRTARPRQRTLRAALDWSYELLSEPEKTLLRRLSVFVGGWTLDAAEGVMGVLPEAQHAPNSILDTLTALVDKSLVVYEEEEGKARYRLLETTLLYSKEQALPADRLEGERRHAEFFLQFAQQAKENIARLCEASAWKNRIREEQDNLRAALAWWRKEDLEKGAALLLLLHDYNLISYHGQEAGLWIARLQENDLFCTPLFAALYLKIGEWADWLGHASAAQHLWEKSLKAATLCDDQRGRAMALLNLGSRALGCDDYEKAASYLQISQSVFQELGEIRQRAEARNRLSALAFYQGDISKARRLLEMSLAEGRECEDWLLIEDTLDALGFIAWQQREYGTAHAHFAELADLLADAGNFSSANALRHLGATEAALGDFSSAWANLEKARAINREVGFLPGEGWDLYCMADLAFQQNDLDAAWANLEGSLRLFNELGEVGSATFCLQRWARFETKLAQWERATCLWSHTERLIERYQSPIPAILRADFDAFIASCRSHLPPAKFEAAWAKGQMLLPDQAMEYARAARGQRK